MSEGTKISDLKSLTLFQAISKGDETKVKALLKAGADVNAKDGDGWTPLYWAVMHSRLQMTRLLLSHGADVNGISFKAHTTLQRACRNGQTDMVRLLLEHGADALAKDEHGRTALDYTLRIPARQTAREEIVDLFRQYAPELVLEQFCTQEPQL